jgi:predicted AlkP superfamily phosphohydrolase/phosphomutase
MRTPSVPLACAVVVALAVAFVTLLPAAHGATKANPIILLGVDGMEWSIIDDLSAKGQLPNITKLRAKAASAKLATDYGAASPVVWTTIATGMNKEVHGIVNFEMGTDDGTVPVSSTMRTVAAIWNMVSIAHRRVLVLGWWGSWPAEAVNGRIVSDRAAHLVSDRVSPEEWEPTFAAELKQASRAEYPRDDDSSAEDRMVQHFVRKGVTEGYDLICAYLHGTDLVSHKYWKYYRPDGFSDVDPAKKAAFADMIPAKYRAVDTVIGQVVSSMPPNANLFVVSDHGFGPLPEEFVRISLNMDELLQRLGLQVKTNGKIDPVASKAYNFGSADFQAPKNVRLFMAGRDTGGTVTAANAAAVRAEITKVLADLTYTTGKPVFAVRDALPYEKQKGADFIAEVQLKDVSTDLLFRGQTITGPVHGVVEHSGGHGWQPPGVFLATGPDIDPKADLKGIRIHDITPTLLYGMDLPVAQDFAGKPWQTLFTAGYRSGHTLQTISSYGTAGPGTATKSAETDQEMLEQLRSLGYIQ